MGAQTPTGTRTRGDVSKMKSRVQTGRYKGPGSGQPLYRGPRPTACHLHENKASNR